MRALHSIALTVFAMSAACGDDAKKAEKKIIDEVDINAKVSTPPPPPSPIGRMRLSGPLPTGGNCSITPYRRDAEMAYQVTYETFAPPRKALMEVGHSLRQFTPVNLQIIGTNATTTLREQETIFAAFSQTGAVTIGTRTYSSEGEVNANERSPLGITDGAEMVAIARKLVEDCPAPPAVRR